MNGDLSPIQREPSREHVPPSELTRSQCEYNLDAGCIYTSDPGSATEEGCKEPSTSSTSIAAIEWAYAPALAVICAGWAFWLLSIATSELRRLRPRQPGKPSAADLDFLRRLHIRY